MSDPCGNGRKSARSTSSAGREFALPITMRVQRKRGKAFKMPENTIYVGPRSMWGNPFERRRWRHAKATILHERWLTGGLGALSLERMGFSPAEIDALFRLRHRVLTALHTLAGKNLACLCPLTSRWCHANLLLRLAAMHGEFERWAA